MSSADQVSRLAEVVRLSPEKLLGDRRIADDLRRSGGDPVLVLLAAGRGTRFGQSPKCAQPVCGKPLARHSIDAFRACSASPAVCLVGYQHEVVMELLGDDNLYIVTGNPTGGTAYAAFETLCVPELEELNPLLIIGMGDRIVPAEVFQRLVETHRLGPREADLTLLTAMYEPPRQRGKGRLLRDTQGRVMKFVEQRDIDKIENSEQRQALMDIREANCPLYALRAGTLRDGLKDLVNDNAQQQYYLTDIVDVLAQAGADIRTITTTPGESGYDLLCSDVTRPQDLALIEGILTSSSAFSPGLHVGVDDALQQIVTGRPPGQVASLAGQIEELLESCAKEKLAFEPDQPVALGISGGRLRIAFMHPDMGRFFGPAWQMPIGAGDPGGREQIVVLMQSSDDGKVHLLPTTPELREKVDFLPADHASMFPGEEITDWYSYEEFGTHMAEDILLSFGYFTDEELQTRRTKGQPLPPPSLWVSNSMRRPFSLVGNAIASIRTLREGHLGARVQTFLGREGFRGLRIVTSGTIPKGGFSSSSAVTVAVKNAINTLYGLGISPDLLVHLACQAEYGTGVRAGSLDQATEQKGRADQGAVISSNPRHNYHVLGVFPVPFDRFRVLFPYSVDRDREAWQWSGGIYAATPGHGNLTAGEMRKMTGKAAELAAHLVRLPLDEDFFPRLEKDLLRDGTVSDDTTRWVCDLLHQLPLRATQDALQEQLRVNRPWHIDQLLALKQLNPAEASRRADAAVEALFTGWRDPLLRRTTPGGETVEEWGAPLRAMLAYLFREVAINFHMIHHPDRWIECVTASQRGDRCVDIDPLRLPEKEEMSKVMEWERHLAGPARMERWLREFAATPVDFNRGLEDGDLEQPSPLHRLEGGSFFRGLALIDLAEAMLKRAFGANHVAVRVNAAGQGDFFQVHVDTERVQVEEVKTFIRAAFYQRFDLSPENEFVEPHPGGGAAGVRLSRFDLLPKLAHRLRAQAPF